MKNSKIFRGFYITIKSDKVYELINWRIIAKDGRESMEIREDE